MRKLFRVFHRTTFDTFLFISHHRPCFAFCLRSLFFLSASLIFCQTYEVWCLKWKVPALRAREHNIKMTQTPQSRVSAKKTYSVLAANESDRHKASDIYLQRGIPKLQKTHCMLRRPCWQCWQCWQTTHIKGKCYSREISTAIELLLFYFPSSATALPIVSKITETFVTRKKKWKKLIWESSKNGSNRVKNT